MNWDLWPSSLLETTFIYEYNNDDNDSGDNLIIMVSGNHLVEDVGPTGDIGCPLLGLELSGLLLLLRHVQVMGPLW